jgi:hypothetical protein
MHAKHFTTCNHYITNTTTMQITFWNLNEIRVEVGKQACAKVVTK